MKFINNGMRTISKLLIAAAFAAAISINPIISEAAVIGDIDTGADFAKASIIRLAQSNIISGDNNGNFHPLNTVKRSEMIKIIVMALGAETENIPEEPTFTDVPKGHWAYKYVEAGYREGIIKGFTSSVFGIDSKCTREEMATIYVRALGLKDVDLQGQQPYLNIDHMTDRSAISTWAREYVEFAIAAGIMKGIGGNAFGAKLPAERQQVAVVTDRFLTGKDAVNKFAGTFKGEVDYPELYNALKENDKKFKGNLDMNIQIDVSDENSDNLSKITMAMKGLLNADKDNEVMNFDIDYDISMMVMEDPNVSQQFKVIKLEDHYYIKYSNSDTWLIKTQPEMEALGVSSMAGNDNSQQLIKYYRYSVINKETNVEFRSINATKYTITLSPEAMEDMMSGMTAEQVADIEGETPVGMKNLTGNIIVYLNENNQVIYEKINFTGSMWDETMESDITQSVLLDAYYYNIGQNINITAPVIAE